MLPVSGDRDLDRAQKRWLFSTPQCLGPQLGRYKEWEYPSTLVHFQDSHLSFNGWYTWAADWSHTCGFSMPQLPYSMADPGWSNWMIQGVITSVTTTQGRNNIPLMTQPQESKSIIHQMMFQVVTSLIRWDCQKEGSMSKNRGPCLKNCTDLCIFF